MHGTNVEGSDEDWRGVYQSPNDDFLGLGPVKETYQTLPDIVMWELGHFIHLLLKGNPNIVGLLWAPNDCVYETSPVLGELRDNKKLFLTLPMAYAYLGWVEQELKHGDLIALSPKRLSHVPRLLWELEAAILEGTLPVRASGWHLDYLRAVRAGRPGYEYGNVADAARRLVQRLKPEIEKMPLPPFGFAEQVLLRARNAR